MGNKVMGNKMMPIVPSYLRCLEEVLFLDSCPALVELMVKGLHRVLGAAVTHNCGSQKKAADIQCAEEFVAPEN